MAVICDLIYSSIRNFESECLEVVRDQSCSCSRPGACGKSRGTQSCRIIIAH